MPDTPDRPPPEILIAFDFGLRRIGVAVGQDVTGSAQPLGIVANGPGGPDWKRLERLLAEWRPTRLVVGMPLHADGSRSVLSAAVDEFVRDLGRFSLPVETIDERYSSLEAEELLIARRKLGMSGRLRKERVDAAAAALIAQRWLARAK
jgi:putative holliday junction resolvase